MAGKRKAAMMGARVGVKVAPKAGRIAWKAGKGEARLIKHALSSREPASARFLKYGLFALVGFAIGALVGRMVDRDSSSNGGGATGGAGHQRLGDVNRTDAERGYSDPSSGPLIGEQHRRRVGDIPEQQEEIENRIRTRIGEDPRTREMPHVNVEVNDGVAELRGLASSEEVKQAAAEIAADTAGVREVRNHLTVA